VGAVKAFNNFLLNFLEVFLVFVVHNEIHGDSIILLNKICLDDLHLLIALAKNNDVGNGCHWSQAVLEKRINKAYSSSS